MVPGMPLQVEVDVRTARIDRLNPWTSPHPRSWTVALCLISLLGAAPSYSDTQVNSYTTDDQRRPHVVVEEDGDFLILWDSMGSSGTDTWGTSIQGQRYASDGSPVGSEFQVNTETRDYQFDPGGAFDADGNFVIAWMSVDSTDDHETIRNIQGQRYASDGSQIGEQFQINTYTTAVQHQPEIAMEADGDFVVVWWSEGSPGTDTDDFSVQARLFSSDGSALGDQFQVNTYTTGHQGSPWVDKDALGNFVVAWDSQGSAGTDDSLGSVHARRYTSDGAPLGDPFQVNTYTTRNQLTPQIAVKPDGDFVIVWWGNDSGGSDTSNASVHGRRYTSDGSAVGDEFQINSYTQDTQFFPSVAYGPQGNFVVVWESGGSYGSDSSSYSMQGQRFASDGAIVGPQFQVNSYTPGNQKRGRVASDGAGNFVITWESIGSSGTDNSGHSIQFTHFPRLFLDGFESGDTSSWSITVVSGEK